MKRDQQLIEKLQKHDFKGIIFDFDGVLLDVREPLHQAVTEVLDKRSIRVDMDLAMQQIGAVLESVQGYPMSQIILQSYQIFKYVTVFEKYRLVKKLRVAIEIFAKYQNYSKECEFHHGTKLLLENLSKHHDLFIISHNITESILRHLRRVDFENFFKDIYGQDKLPALKPDPASVEAPLDHYKSCIKEDFVVLGDMPTDIEAGKGAGFWTIAVSSGLCTKELLAENEPDLLLDSIEDILPLLGVNTGRIIKSQANTKLKTESL
jgi:HAD superfamily hydrolase (TIGR01549 family)